MMTTAPLPFNEKDRLAALRQYNILDTPPEANFDRITKLATQLFNAPIGLVSLVDEFRAWFKSYRGFEASEIPRDAALCSFAVLFNDVLVVPDARQDPRFACNPSVESEPGIRFYAGAPLITHDGFNLGTLCVLDTQPHSEFTLEQRTTLSDLAAMVIDELELRLVAQKLEQAQIEQVQLLKTAQQAQAQAEAANTSKDEFIAILSHELRTPLNAILGWASILLSQTQDEATTTRALQTIARNAKLQSQLIEDLLDVTRVVQGKIRLEFSPVNLIPVVTEAIDALQPAAEAKQIHLEAMLTSCPGTVSADPDRLQQVIWNLLSNAIKFTPDGGQVEVRLACSPTQAQIQIVDTGRGITPEFLPHVFDRFRQAEGASNKTHTGVGLGLTIVKHLVELHNGTIAADSLGKGQGATFTVRLPLVSVFAPADQLERYPVASDQGKVVLLPKLDGVEVLLVDDDSDIREILLTVLETEGAIVTTVSSAVEALAVIAEKFEDDSVAGAAQLQRLVLVSDIGMPDEDGYTLIRQVRQLPVDRGGRIPAIALTGYVREKDKTDAFSVGFQHHLEKPFEVSSLVAAVSQLLADSVHLSN